MENARELYEERLNQIKTAVALGKPDRVPVVPLGQAFCARHMRVKLADFCMNPELSHKTILESFTSLGEVDGLQSATCYPLSLQTLWLSRVKLPGRDLPDDELWQMDEKELMTIDDYDVIIDKGYNHFIKEYYRERLDNLEERLQPFLAYQAKAAENLSDHGIVLFRGGNFTIPYENFCGGRSMQAFLRDLYRIPDKVQAAMDAAIVDIIENTRKVLRVTKPIGVWVGGWRSASEFLSPRLWQRFVFPYIKQLAEAVVEEGVIAILHFDSNWTRDLAYLRELPKGKCVLALDGATDIFKAKEVLGDHMCIMGDVPPAMLALGTPDDVHNYCRKLIENIGPSGFILSQGCDIPPNARPENVKAMIESVKG